MTFYTLQDPASDNVNYATVTFGQKPRRREPQANVVYAATRSASQSWTDAVLFCSLWETCGWIFYFYFSFAIRFVFEEADICLGPIVLWEYAAVEGLVR